MKRFFYRNVLVPAIQSGIKRRKWLRYARDLDKTQWSSREELVQIQFENLRNLIGHAFKTCPYYRDDWARRGLRLDDLKTPEDFARWPITGRETILENRERMRTENPPHKLISKATGGSSGVPLRFDIDLQSYDRRLAAIERGYGWAGGGLGSKKLLLWGVALGETPWKKRVKDSLFNALYRQQILNVFELSEDSVPAYFEAINRSRPDVIIAYANAIHSFARSLEARGLVPFSPKSLITGAEKLHPHQRADIERVFRAPVFETYGSREFTLMGAECERHEGFHVTMEQLLLEIVDDEGQPTPDGEEGNVVVTDLFNYGMPFVRYLNGDRARAGWHACSCGRGLPLLKEVVGRRSDILQTPDGRQITGLFFPHLVKDFPAIKRFQVVQEVIDRIDISLVLVSELSQTDRSRLEAEIRKVFGPEMSINLVAVDDIPLTRAGKHQVIINRLK